MKNVVKSISGLALLIFGILSCSFTVSMLDRHLIQINGISHEVAKIGGAFSLFYYLGIASIILGFLLIFWSIISEHFSK